MEYKLLYALRSGKNIKLIYAEFNLQMQQNSD